MNAAALGERLRALAVEHDVPGASLAVLHDERVTAAAHGLLNVETGVEATTDSLFQIGSVTKPYTATVAMRLVEQGRLSLDRPLRELLPELRLADERVAATVTLRHLLTHTSGIAGDFFPDTGSGDDALERYAEQCADLGQDLPIGVTMSYSNSGYVLVGRAIERATGLSWDAAMRELLFEPLGLRRTVTLAEEALRFRVAWGHETGGESGPRLVPSWGPPRALGPAGLICATAADVIAFARLQLDSGVAASGERLLSDATAAEMVRPQVTVPEPWSTGDHWGLGWWLHDWDGARLFAHDGSLPGQLAYLKAVPQAGVAIALLTNGGDGDALARALNRELLRELCGIAMPSPPAAAASHASDPAVLGTYARHGVRLDVVEADEQLRATTRLVEPLASQFPDQRPSDALLTPSDAGAEVYLSRDVDGGGDGFPLVFFSIDDDRYVHSSARALRKER